MRTSYVILILFFLLASCDELLRTQTKPLELTFSKNGTAVSPLEFNADGATVITVNAISDREMAPGQSITFTTTDGSLHALNDTSLSSKDKLLTVVPLDKSATIFLKTSRVAKDPVFVGVTINKLTTITPVRFKVVCPDRLNPSIDLPQISLAAKTEGKVEIELLRTDDGPCSDNIRIDLIPDDKDIIDIPLVGYTVNGKATFAYTPNAVGRVTIEAKVITPTCTSVASAFFDIEVMP